MRDLKEWAEDNGAFGSCQMCGTRTWIEYGCDPLCMSCSWLEGDVDEPDAEEETEETFHAAPQA